jgi:hypothetical protein
MLPMIGFMTVLSVIPVAHDVNETCGTKQIPK